MKTVKLFLVILFSLTLVSCGGGGSSGGTNGPTPCADVTGASTLNIGSTTGGTYWSVIGVTRLGFDNRNLNFYGYISGDGIADMGAVCLGDVTTLPTTGSFPVAYIKDHVYVVEYQDNINGSLIRPIRKRYYKFVATDYSQGSVTITWVQMFSASAVTTAQNLVAGTPMFSFTPLTASGGVTPYTYSYTGTLPDGLSFDTMTGAVTGTPTATYATADLVFSVMDANNIVASTTSTVSFTVAPDPAIAVLAGLTWMQVTFTDTWSNANAFCSGTINGQTGWRQPTVVELKAMFTTGAASNQGWTLGDTWSSEANTRLSRCLVGSGTQYNFVSMLDGRVALACNSISLYVSCVR